MEWLVRLDGDEWSLEDLPEWFSQLDHKVRLEDRKYYLTSSALKHCTASSAVYELAEQIVERINGASRAFQPRFRPVQLGSEIVQVLDDGTRRVHQHIVVKGHQIWVKMGRLTPLSGGNPPPPQPSEPERLVAQWEAEGHSSDLGRVLRVWLLPQTWGSLYHIYESIKYDMSGRKRVRKDDWKALLPLLPNVSEAEAKRQLDRFRGTANDPEHAGIHARHGRPEPKPEPDPMTLIEAQGLVHQLLVAWLSGRPAKGVVIP